MNKLINSYLENYGETLNKDSKYVSFSDINEKKAVKNSKIIIEFNKKYDRCFIDFNDAYNTTAEELTHMKSRKTFYQVLLSKTVSNKDLNIELE